MEIDRLLNDAYRRLQHGQTNGAIDTLRQILGQAPDVAEAHALLALCLLDKRRVHAARRETTLALANEPELQLAHYAAARVAIAQRRFKTAESHLTRLLEANPLSATYYRALAQVYALTGQKRKILPLLEKALELDPESAESLAALGDHYLGQGDSGRAEQYLRQALQQQPDHLDSLVSMGHLLLKRGEVDAAREHAIWALRANPDSVQALHLMSAIKARQSIFLGLWWRYNSWMTDLGPTRSVIVLLVAFMCYRIAMIVTEDLGYPQGAQLVSALWLAVVVYSFTGPALFSKSLKKELGEVQLARNF